MHAAAALMYVVLLTVHMQLAQCNNALESNFDHFIISQVIYKCLGWCKAETHIVFPSACL